MLVNIARLCMFTSILIGSAANLADSCADNAQPDEVGRFRGTLHCHGKFLRHESVVALRSLNCLS